MEDFKIRIAYPSDYATLADLWLRASIIAHDFIASDYWQQHRDTMQQHYLPQSEVYVYVDDQQVLGFIALVEDNVAAIFVEPKNQGKGIGKKLLNYAKQKRTTLVLHVYQKNQASVAFYSQQFLIVQNTVDANTEQAEYVMQWHKE